MPRRDGTGPMGAGSMTGRGLGFCTGANAVKYGAGPGMGLGLGLARRRGFGCINNKPPAMPGEARSLSFK